MAWPNNMQYFEAVQNPQTSFQDVELRQGKVDCTDMGMPKADGGNFAQVYKIVTPANKSWAIKCFTREVPGLQARYQHISDCLQKANLPFTVDFQYLDQGICIKGQWYPLLKMHWVEGGEPLNLFVKRHLDNPKMLQGLVDIWSKMAQQLHLNQIAHADLQHGNVLLVSQPNDFVRLTLIDYDGMIVPALANQPSGEAGHPNFQHPQRQRKQTYHQAIDNFSHLVICCGLRCLSAVGQPLWHRFDNEENLLFKESDFEDPAHSTLLHELWNVTDPLSHALVAHLVLACLRRLEDVPRLDQLLSNSLSPSLENDVQRILRKTHSVLPPNTPPQIGDPWWLDQTATRDSRRTITFSCGSCNSFLIVGNEWQGIQARCDACGGMTMVPVGANLDSPHAVDILIPEWILRPDIPHQQPLDVPFLPGLDQQTIPNTYTSPPIDTSNPSNQNIGYVKRTCFAAGMLCFACVGILLLCQTVQQAQQRKELQDQAKNHLEKNTSAAHHLNQTRDLLALK